MRQICVRRNGRLIYQLSLIDRRLTVSRPEYIITNIDVAMLALIMFKVNGIERFE